MTEPLQATRIRRVVVALDASADSVAALNAAASLAVVFEAELQGIFVEDINLLRVAQLPFVQQVVYPVADVSHIDVPQLRRHWRAQAQAARRCLADIAAELDLDWSFEVAQGLVTACLLASAEAADLLALGRYGHSFSSQVRRGSTARQAVLEGRPSVLLMRADTNLDSPVLLIQGEDLGATRALRISALLAQGSGRLQILVWTADNEVAHRIQREVMQELETLPLEISFRRSYPGLSDQLARLVNGSEAGLLVLSGTLPGLDADLLHRWLDQVQTSLLIVR